MKNYILRKIDPDLWAKVKARSKAEGITLRAIILKLLALYGAGQVTLSAGKVRTSERWLTPENVLAYEFSPTEGEALIRGIQERIRQPRLSSCARSAAGGRMESTTRQAM